MVFDVSTRQWVDVCFRELSISDVKKYGLTRGNSWFDWKREFSNKENKVFGLFVLGNNIEIQGVIAIQELYDNQLVHISLMESAPHNRFDTRNQKYGAVGKNLLAFAMKHSLTIPEFEGFVGLFAKKNRNEAYYKVLEGEISMYLEGKPYYYFKTETSKSIVAKYLPGGIKICPK